MEGGAMIPAAFYDPDMLRIAFRNEMAKAGLER
jgi:hypothetical protein